MIEQHQHIVPTRCGDFQGALDRLLALDEALEALAKQRPDVILLDLLMPHLDGFGVLEYLRQESHTRDVPVLVLTAKTLTTEEQTLLQERVLKVLQKQGLERDALIQELQSALQAYRHQV